jgi:outer membrane protein with beta-barrel domain
VVDNFVDVNGNGLSDQYEGSLGGHPLALPDTDGDGFDNHRDLDSDGDGISDVIESGGVDANGDGRHDGVDADRDGLVDSADGSLNGGHAPARPDSDGDGMRDSLDTDSDNDQIPDAREGRGDSDGDGVPDSLDAPGKLQTAVRGAGALDPASLLGLVGVIGFVALRRMGRVRVARVLPVVACALLGAQAFEAQAGETQSRGTHSKGWYAGFDLGMSRVEPRIKGGGYKLDDEQSMGYRLELGYSWSKKWSAEAFYADGGEAGVSSDNAAVGHLGTISYKMYGAGVEWAPLEDGRRAKWFPLIKAGAVSIRNSASSPNVNYERLNDIGVYFGGGAGLRLGSWSALGEVVSYDQDELFFTLGIRKRF